jgi:hypothetical protein
MEELYVGEYREQDIPDILNLFFISFQKKASKDWFLWKYQYSPWGSKGYVVIADKMVVAFYGGIKLQFKFNDKKLWAYQFCDVMTHPEYRARLVSKTPLIVRLGKMFYRENMMDFAFGFPSLRHAKLQSLRLGGEGYRLVRMYKKEHLKRHFIAWKLKVKEGWEYFGKWDEGGLSGKNTLQLVKDEGYIRWRYIENPSKEYRLLAFKRMNITRGYIIFIIEDNWFNVLEILYEEDRDVKDILVVLETYIAKNMKTLTGIRLWFHPMEQGTGYLDSLGYGSEGSIPLAFRSVNKTCHMSTEIFYDRYFYRMGDYDAS